MCDVCEPEAVRRRVSVPGAGFAVAAVDADEDRQVAGYAYTVGLPAVGHPELVVAGLGHQHARRLLRELGERVAGGAGLADGAAVRAHSINPPELRTFVLTEPVLGAGQPVPALQVVYADFRGAYPWEPAYCYPHWVQPVPALLVAT